MDDLELPGPPLKGFAIRLLEDRPAKNQKKGYYLKMGALPTTQLEAQKQLIAFTPKPQRVFSSAAEAHHVRDQLTAIAINTEVVEI